MSEESEVTNSEESVQESQEAKPEDTPPKKPVPKAKSKPMPKKSPVKTKPAKKAVKAVKKAVKKAPAKKPKGTPRPAKDNARKVARASDGKLSTDQVRILRSLIKGRPCTMADIKKGCHIAEDQKYSGGFLKGLQALGDSKLVKIESAQESRAYTYTITEKGKAALQKAEAAAKE